jgi:predicted AlkP superfamily pyrophosphatase or phosphodiesterase
MGCHPDVDYLIDEYWMPKKTDTLESSFREAGSSPEVIEIIKKNAHLLPDTYVKTGRKNFMVHPYDDEFLVACAADIIRQFAPEVTFVHNGQIDGIRHTCGAFGDHLYSELDRVDKHIGQLCEALEDAGVLADTDIFVVSDHGQIEIKRTIKLNALLADHGLVDVNEKGKCVDYRAYCLSNAMSSLVYLKDPADKELHDRVYKLLCDLRDEGIYGFSKVWTREEIAELEHLDGDFSFVIESDGYTSFSDSCKRPLIAPLDLTDFRFGRATHGYYPDLGPQPTLIAKGPHIKEGVVIDRRPIVDEAPTYAKLLEVDLPDAQGSPIEEILK